MLMVNRISDYLNVRGLAIADKSGIVEGYQRPTMAKRPE